MPLLLKDQSTRSVCGGPAALSHSATFQVISEHNFSGLNSDPRFNPPLMAFISEPHFFGVEPMPIAINMAYGDSWHQSICSPRNKPWEYKPKPNRFLVHSHCANRNEPKRTKGLLNLGVIRSFRQVLTRVYTSTQGFCLFVSWKLYIPWFVEKKNIIKLYLYIPFIFQGFYLIPLFFSKNCCL